MNALLEHLIKSWYFIQGLFDISLITGMSVTLLQARVDHETVSEILNVPANMFLLYGGCAILVIRIASGVIDLIIKYKGLNKKEE
tara:strand:- start:1002 stop:1256 length:255 start_codon:yes stop_codon:yes gene_type:complete